MSGARWLAAFAAAAGAFALWLWLVPASSPPSGDAPTPDTGTQASERGRDPGEATGGDLAAATDAAPAVAWQVLLLPDGSVRARPESVRVGLAEMPAEDLAASLDGGAGSAPESAGELARVHRWIAVPGTLQEDGSVRVSTTLARADRYVLQAMGEDGLRQYDADFSADAPPASVRPLVGAGLRVRRDPALAGEISLLLRRRGELADAPRWRRLLERHPQIRVAYDDSPLGLTLPLHEWAPLPPQAIEVLWLVDGIEAQALPLLLRPGQWHEIALDPLAHAVARELSVDLRLRVVGDADQAPIEGVEVRMAHPRGERVQHTGPEGETLLTGLDRQQTLSLQLHPPSADDELPRWPASLAAELALEELARETGAGRVLAHTLEVAALRWLVVQSPSLPLDPARTAGQPYPVFVLQRRDEGAWSDVPADYFRSVEEGLAVSLAADGEYRVAAVLAPWTLATSAAADTRRASRDGRHRVRLDPPQGHACELLVTRDGAPLARAQLMAIGPLRGMPPMELVADLQGRVRLSGVNVDSLRVEVPGFEQLEVDLRGPTARLELQAAR